MQYTVRPKIVYITVININSHRVSMPLRYQKI